METWPAVDFTFPRSSDNTPAPLELAPCGDLGLCFQEGVFPPECESGNSDRPLGPHVLPFDV